jgi:hypothetical protein
MSCPTGCLAQFSKNPPFTLLNSAYPLKHGLSLLKIRIQYVKANHLGDRWLHHLPLFPIEIAGQRSLETGIYEQATAPHSTA